MLTDLPSAPFGEIQSAFEHLSSRNDLTDRLNNAYKKNLVFKDSFANGNGGPQVDMKSVLDLSPERLDEIAHNDPDLALHQGSLGETLAYWELLRTTVAPKLVDAVADAVGCPSVKVDAAINYRMVDYYERQTDMVPPRCGEHRDFGSFTLVFPSRSGFQIHIDGEWKDVDLPSSGAAILVFGWCTQIRSNGRIPAVLHRVVDGEEHGSVVPRRISAVLFCAPKSTETLLEPLVREGEERVYVSGIKVGQLRGKMARKWRHREGTLDELDKILEEKEILATNMRTQDDVVKTMVIV